MTRILVVDDEPQIRKALAVNLTARGYEVDTAATGEDALARAAAHLPDLVLLDIGLPGIDGIDVVVGLRGWTTVPIIMLSVRDAEEDKVRALDAGADDYVTKPFGMNEVLARLRAALRRHHPEPEQPVVVTGAFRLDLAQRVARLTDGAAVHLTPDGVGDRGRAWSVIPVAWSLSASCCSRCGDPQYERETNYLRVHLAAIRKKLEPEPGRPRYFVTEPGIGYRFEPDPSSSAS